MRGNGTLDQSSECRQPCDRCWPDQRRQLARGLPVHEHPVAHDVPPLRLHAFIVIPHGREAAGLRAIGHQVDDGVAEAELAGVAGLEEAGAGHVRFPPQRAIEFRGVTDRLVDRQKQLRRIDDDVVAAGDDGLRLELLDDFVAGLFGVAQPRVVLDVFVAEELRAIDHRPRLEVAAGAVGGRRR